jgi:hypothetical protein
MHRYHQHISRHLEWVVDSVTLNQQDRPASLIQGYAQASHGTPALFPRPRPGLVKSPSQTSTHQLAPSISPPVSSLLSSQASSIRKYPRTHCLQNYLLRSADMSVRPYTPQIAYRTTRPTHISTPLSPGCTSTSSRPISIAMPNPPHPKD